MRLRGRSPSGLLLLAILVLVGLGSVSRAAADTPPRVLCPLHAANPLPPGTLHGPLARMHPYPAVWLAGPAQRSAARKIMATVRESAAVWGDPRRARGAGFVTKRPERTQRNRSTVLLFHAERSAASPRDGRVFDPTRPKALVYADEPGRKLRLLGVMYGMRRGLKGATPGGPVTRWHTHPVCVLGARRGIKPRSDGSCPAGHRLEQGNEMMHVWLTRDMRSAFSLHAPERELCVLQMLRGGACARWRR